MFKIGVVCEGQTDFVAIKIFLEAEFRARGKVVKFTMIHPASDGSLPAGWPQVLFWLENNELSFRSALYLKGDALFQTEDEDKKFDALLYQIDSDIIGEKSFEAFIKKRDISYTTPKTNTDRGNVIRDILLRQGQHASDEEALSKREVVAPTVESSEAWLIAAENLVSNAEHLSGQSLIDAFGDLVARARNRPPMGSYKNINKSIKTREFVCNSIATNSTPFGRAHHYDEVVQKISRLCLVTH
jgi:hypothetical protein